MRKILQKIKEISMNPDLRLRVYLDADARFSVHIEWAGIIIQWLGIFYSSFPLILIGSVGFWYGFVRYVKNILRIHDEYKKEKEEEKAQDSSNKNEETEEDKEA